MALKITEDFDSREFGRDFHIRRWTVRDDQIGPSLDETAVQSLVLQQIASVTPSINLGLKEYTVRRIGANAWRANVRWEEGEAKDEEDVVISFDTTGGMEKVYQGETIDYIGGDPVDPQGVINFDGKQVQGVDVVVPKFGWKLNGKVDAAHVTFAYVGTIFELTGTMNDAAYKGFPRGTLLFLGCTGTIRIPSTNDADLTYHFAGSPNKENFDVGGINVPEKLGWDYLEVQYKDDESENKLLKIPRQVNIQRVYEFGNYGLLGV